MRLTPIHEVLHSLRRNRHLVADLREGIGDFRRKPLINGHLRETSGGEPTLIFEGGKFFSKRSGRKFKSCKEVGAFIFSVSLVVDSLSTPYKTFNRFRQRANSSFPESRPRLDRSGEHVAAEALSAVRGRVGTTIRDHHVAANRGGGKFFLPSREGLNDWVCGSFSTRYSHLVQS